MKRNSCLIVTESRTHAICKQVAKLQRCRRPMHFAEFPKTRRLHRPTLVSKSLRRFTPPRSFILFLASGVHPHRTTQVLFPR